MGKCYRTAWVQLLWKSYHSTLPFALLYICIYERPGNLQEALKFELLWEHFFCHSIMGSWTRPRLHNFLIGISNMNKFEQPKISSYAAQLVLNKMVEEKKAQIYEASQSFMQSHSKENGKYLMFCHDVTCTWDWTQFCYIFPLQYSKFCQHKWSIGQAVSIFFVLYFILGCCRGVCWGSPGTGL